MIWFLCDRGEVSQSEGDLTHNLQYEKPHEHLRVGLSDLLVISFAPQLLTINEGRHYSQD